MKRRALAFAVLTALGFAAGGEAQVAAPAPGCVRYDGRLPIQNILGVSGSFVLGPAELGAAEAASFSDKVALVASGGQIKLLRKDGKLLAAYLYAGAAPVLSITEGAQSAAAWLPEAYSLLRFDGRAFVATPLAQGTLPGIVTSVALVSPQWASLLVSQADGSVARALVELPDGDVRSTDLLPGVAGPAYRFNHTLIWRDGDGLQTEDILGGERHTLPAPEGSFSAERMSGPWVHLFFAKSNTHWALFLDKAGPVLSRLPAATAAPQVRP